MCSSDIAIKVDGIGKRYYTPQRTLAIRGNITGHFKNLGLLGKHSEEDYFWALKDVSFEVRRGKILGIMGKNGSGKSTLLKILTGVTPPTEGRAILRGKVGSLLEVGTGFHPDLSGRDNVFMNGALLGLSRSEIRARMDEIINFSGIEGFIDVPVKRYSSGMYVRLAYAVASMLQSEILILDEVLAVGDMAFQDKARKSMQEIVKSGRTILIVSHHVHSLASICEDGMVLHDGRPVFYGNIKEAIQNYLRRTMHLDSLGIDFPAFVELSGHSRMYHHTSKYTLKWISLQNKDGISTTFFNTGEDMVVRIGYEDVNLPHPYFSLLIHNEYGDRVASINSTHTGNPLPASGTGVTECVIRDLRLGEGTYTIMVDFGFCTGHRATFQPMECVPAAILFRVDLKGFVSGVGVDPFQGAVHKSEWVVF